MYIDSIFNHGWNKRTDTILETGWDETFISHVRLDMYAYMLQRLPRIVYHLFSLWQVQRAVVPAERHQ